MATALRGLGLGSLVSIAAACARSELADPMPELPPGYRPLVSTAPPLWVPAGNAWVGNMEFDQSSRRMIPSDCREHNFAHGYLVAGFFLDADEVRGSDYLACVTAGACPVPAVAFDPDLAATLSAAELESYCAFRGGRLPLASELARASTGDDLGLTTDSFLRAWLACNDGGFQGDGCAMLALRAPNLVLHERSTPLAIRADPDDIGPFGHWDLFGSQIELTATFDGTTLDGEDMPVCAHPNWFLEPPSTSTQGVGEAARLGHAPAWGLANESPWLMQTEYGDDVLMGYWVFINFDESGLYGGRCAYDPVYKLPGEDGD